MGKIIIKIVGLIILMVAVVSIYDARKISIKNFNTGEVNSATKILKVIGFIVLIIGLLIIYISY